MEWMAVDPAPIGSIQHSTLEPDGTTYQDATLMDRSAQTCDSNVATSLEGTMSINSGIKIGRQRRPWEPFGGAWGEGLGPPDRLDVGVVAHRY